MSDLDCTPQTPLQFPLEDCEEQATPQPSLDSQEIQNDSSVFTDQESVEGKVISLAAKAKKDAKLTEGWGYHSSEDDDYSPNKENEEDKDSEESSDDEEVDEFHEECVSAASALMDHLREKGWKAKKKKEAQAALAGALEDFFKRK